MPLHRVRLAHSRAHRPVHVPGHTGMPCQDHMWMHAMISRARASTPSPSKRAVHIGKGQCVMFKSCVLLSSVDSGGIAVGTSGCGFFIYALSWLYSFFYSLNPPLPTLHFTSWGLGFGLDLGVECLEENNHDQAEN